MVSFQELLNLVPVRYFFGRKLDRVFICFDNGVESSDFSVEFRMAHPVPSESTE